MKTIQLTPVIAIFSAIALYSSTLVAGTVVTIKSENDVMTVLTDGKQARMNIGDSDYVIVNYSDNSVKAIDKQKHQVMLLSVEDMPKTGHAPAVQIAVNSLGDGPSIAGYKTQKFSYLVNGKTCGVIYGSQDAYQMKGIKDLFNALQTMAERQQAMMGGYASMIDDCTLGDIKLADHAKTIGVPMRTEEKGVIDSEIKSIKIDVALPADTFVIPASYKTVNINEEIQNVKNDMSNMQQQMQQYQPQMQQMMQQMQQSGQISPEMMEQMRQAQEMMKQYQQ